jgi:tRNA wybutosine-synthesizing protein 4
MSFTTRNFKYVAKGFGEFIDQVDNGAKFYLRSLSMDKPTELPADISRDFPSIAHDFRIPPEFAGILKNFHSSPLRISGPVIMWLHYDVSSSFSTDCCH